MLTSMIKAVRGWFGKSDIRAGMDLTKTTSENRNHWRDADALGARATYSPSERKTARERSRLEFENNSFYSGMGRTAANHVVGTGPRLQVITTDSEVNARIERAWRKWSESTEFVSKLRVAYLTHWRDGDVFGMRTLDSAIDRTLPQTNFTLYEADQVSYPFQVIDQYIDDGKRVNALGRPVSYYIRDNHPGEIGVGAYNTISGEWYPAERVFHLFRADRPGQLHGVPRCAPAIDYLAHMRRYDKAVLSAAEAAALWAVFVKMSGPGATPVAMPEDFMDVEFRRNVLNFLPEGWEPVQLRPEHPTTTAEQFQRALLTYFCRCANMPFALALGTARDSNFASAKMDIANLWEPEVRAEQKHLELKVVKPIFQWFLEDAIFTPSILDGAPPLSEIDFQFHWDPVPLSDPVDAATAAEKRIKAGISTLPLEWARDGRDFDEHAARAAEAYGISEEEYRQALFRMTFNVQPVALPQPQTEVVTNE